MDAIPVTLGSEFYAYVTALTKAKNSILDSQKQLEEIALGGTAVGTGLNSHRNFATKVAEKIAFNLINFLQEKTKLEYYIK